MLETGTGGDPRVELAVRRSTFANFRTQLALDRTTLAWLRTTLTMATFGFGLVGFFRSLRQGQENERTVALHEHAVAFGTALIVLGMAATVLAGVWHWRALKRLRRNELPQVTSFPLSLAVAFLVVLIGAAGLAGVLSNR